MVGAGEVGHRVGHEERLDVAHERLQRGGLTPDVGVDVRDDELVAPGRGELVGVNFDRVWENVSNDFAYNPDVGRNVNADVRYLLWMLELTGATRLLAELKVP